MSGLSLALNNALSGLAINQKSLAVLSHNIANANTPGYSRQVVQQSARIVAGVGSGVEMTGIARKIDSYLLTAAQNQSAVVERSSVMADFADRAQVLMGRPGSGASIDHQIQLFFSALQNLSISPDSTSLQATAVNNGAFLAGEVSALAEGINELRYQADVDIKNSIASINSIIQQLHTVNRSLASASALGGNSASLLDARDNAIGELMGYIGINATYQSNGEVRISTTNGVALLEENPYELSYQGASSPEAFLNDEPLGGVYAHMLDGETGQRLSGSPVTLVTPGRSSEVTSGLSTGKIRGLLDVRDAFLPEMLEQLDMLASTITDTVNAIHNDGSGFPGATSLTGTQPVYPDEWFAWSGSVRIAVLRPDGSPAPDAFGGPGLPPMELDLGSLESGFGQGRPTVQTILDEINQYYGVPQNRASLGGLDNITLTAMSPELPGSPPQLEFDFDLQNLSDQRADFFMSGVTVRDSNGVDITNASNTLPTMALSNSGTFTTTAGSGTVRVTTTLPHGLQNGDSVYLPDPGGDVDGIPQAAMTGYFTIANITATGFDIVAAGTATAGGNQSVPGLTAQKPWQQVGTGETSRSGERGSYTLNLGANSTSPFYDITAQVATVNADGSVSEGTVTYRVLNNDNATRNQRYAATAVAGDAALTVPSSTQSYMQAVLVDETGRELPKIDGQYASREGFLQLRTTSGNYTIAIDEMDSREMGRASGTDRAAPTNRGFSHFFEMNNFFRDNPTGTLYGSAYNMAVEERLRDNPSLMTTGSLQRSAQPDNPADGPVWTYERYAGDNGRAEQMALLSSNLVDFSAAGGLPAGRQTLGGYAASMLGFNAAQAVAAESAMNDAQTLLSGFQERASAISGVNLDEELANTIIFQNAYTASARVVTVTNELFEALLNVF